MAAVDPTQIVTALAGFASAVGLGGWIVRRSERPEREKNRIDALTKDYVEYITKALEDRDDTIDELKSRMTELEREAAELRDQAAALRDENRERGHRIDELERRLNASA